MEEGGGGVGVGGEEARAEREEVELAAGGEVAGVSAELDEVAVRPRVRRHGREPWRELHSLL